MYIYNNISTSELVCLLCTLLSLKDYLQYLYVSCLRKDRAVLQTFAEALKTMLKDLVIPVVVKILHNLIEGRRFIGLCRFCHYLFLI